MKLVFAILVISLSASADAVTDKLSAASRPELPHVAASLVRTNAAARPTVLRWIASHRPAALEAVTRTIAENRPPVTPGNEHGHRPTVPPGPHNYASP